MTKKKAIKTIMAVTHYGNRSWANKLFDYCMFCGARMVNEND